MNDGLTCPKCQGAMRSYERSGVTVDQCTECRGIFLDRGELERLADAENAFHESPPPQREPQYREEYREPRREQREEHYREREHHGYGHEQHGKKRKKRSLFEELFD
jgi:uncharacterized protein